MPYFNIVAETNENTVVTEYEPVPKRAEAYQSEAQLEKEFISMLCEQGYSYLRIELNCSQLCIEAESGSCFFEMIIVYFATNFV